MIGHLELSGHCHAFKSFKNAAVSEKIRLIKLILFNCLVYKLSRSLRQQKSAVIVQNIYYKFIQTG